MSDELIVHYVSVIPMASSVMTQFTVTFKINFQSNNQLSLSESELHTDTLV